MSYFADSWMSYHPSGSELGQVVRPLFGPAALAGFGGSLPVTISGASISISGSFGSEIQADQGVPGNIANPWFIANVSGGVYVGTPANPFWITGSVFTLNPGSGGGGGGTVTGSVGLTGPITGSVGITSPVAVSNFPSSFSVSNFPATQAVTGTVGLTGPITGTVSISSVVAVSQGTSPWTVTGSVGITGPLTGTVGLSGPITGTVGISSAVAVSNFPSTQNVSVQNFPSVQTITGSVGLTGPVTGAVKLSEAVAVSNFPSSFNVGNFPASQNVTGSAWTPTVTGSVGISAPVAVSNFPGSFNVGNFPASQTVTGSVGLTGPVTGTVGISGPITGTVALASAVAVSNFPGSFNVGNFPGTQNVQDLSGSVVGLLQGGLAVSMANPIPITGSVYVINQSAGGAASNVTAVSGSVTGLLVGGVALSSGNPVPVTGAVGITAPIAVSNFPSSFSVSNFPATQNVTGSAWTPTITGSVIVANTVQVTGSVSLTQGVAVTNFPGSQTVAGTVTAVQGTSAAIGSPWVTTLVSGGVYIGTPANPLSITGSLSLTQAVAVSNFPANQSVTQGTSPWIVSGSAWTPTVTGSVVVANQVNITGSVGITAAVAVNNFPASFNVGNFPATQVISGSAWTPTITGSVVVANQVNITGTVGIASSVAVNNFPANQQVNGTVTSNQGTANATPWAVTGSVQIVSGGLGAQVLNSAPGSDTGQPALAVRVISSVGGGSAVTAQSGSVVGLLQGGQAVSMANPVPITGSVFVINQGGAGSNVTAQSGSVTGLLVGGVALSSGNPVPVTGTVAIASSVAVNNFPASQTVAGSVSVSNFPGTQNVQDVSGSVVGLLVGGVAVAGTNPVPVTGAVSLASAPQIASGSVAGLLVGGVALGIANPLPISGTVTLNTALGGAGTSVNPIFITGSAGNAVTNGVNVTNVTGSVTSLVVLPANAKRTKFTLALFAPTAVSMPVFVKFGNAAASNSFSLVMSGGSNFSNFYESTNPVYQGAITAVFGTATGSLGVSEWV